MKVVQAMNALPLFEDAAATAEWSFDNNGYVPIKRIGTVNAGTFENDGHVNQTFLGSNAGLAPWIDYVPVKQDAAKTVPWSTDANGFIPTQV